MDRVNLNTRELLGRIMTGRGETNTSGSSSTTAVTDRVGSGSTTETAEINYLDAVPAIDR